MSQSFKTGILSVVGLCLGVSSACGGPSLVEHCQLACQHLYKDCFTGNACSKCTQFPEDTIGEAHCEADCGTRPTICRDQAQLYACLQGTNCGSPETEFVERCYAAAQCASLMGANPGPAAALANFTASATEVDGQLENSPGGSIEIDRLDWAGANSFCQGNVSGVAVGWLAIQDPGGLPLPIPETFTADPSITSCPGCEPCPDDAGVCASIELRETVGWQPPAVTGTIELLDVDPLHVAGNFTANQALADGGGLSFAGSFDAPNGCFSTPAQPCFPFCGCSSGGPQLGAGLLVVLFLRPWRRRRRPEPGA